MKIYIFCHSVISDWNNINAHFLRGVIGELISLGHNVKAFEEKDNWSLFNLIKEQGVCVVDDFRRRFPELVPEFYDPGTFDPARTLHDADLVIVHEWNDPELAGKIGEYKSENPHFTLLFHDTHHRAVAKPPNMEKINLQHYDGVLVSGEILKKIYLEQSWSQRVWTWHEAADTGHFYPHGVPEKEGDLVWICNWGDDERTEELVEFIINPVKRLGLRSVIYGVRYPDLALRLLEYAGIEYRGWLPNYRVPEIFARFRFTVHLPRRPFTENLPGIPTIRPFEAMACGIPLISSAWEDSEHLFRSGEDFLMVNDGEEMIRTMKQLMGDNELAAKLVRNGLETIRNRHSCRHRAVELLKITETIRQTRSRAKYSLIG